ncbi:uncharacterized protein LOC131165321 isoform X2 [Malania oleifera]|uniref:uncharacterized protein LOC131165321 isoform X2 n=1 Tax=Malania oleifera TaxID=397392 RepID=UPI0025ADD57F|nr:uncharacterized protein LOC131165321 isoform X2 [Malania oleifera]
MKFEDFLMQPTEEHKKTLNLQEEVAKLQAELEEQQKLNRVLHCALHGPFLCQPCLSSFLPLQVQVLLTELAMVEEEIVWLESKVEKLKLGLYQQKKHTKLWEAQQQQQHTVQQEERHLLRQLQNQTDEPNEKIKQHLDSVLHEEFRKYKVKREGKAPLPSPSEFQMMCSITSNEDMAGKARKYNCSRSHGNQSYFDEERSAQKPNHLSEELIKSLIAIFLRLNPQALPENEGAMNGSKHTLSCMKSRGLRSKTSTNRKAPAFHVDSNASNLDPYGIFSYLEGAVRDIGPYKNFVQITRSCSLDDASISECFPAIEKLRELMLKLCNVDLTFLTYKQKLAFWINIYNACIMHAFLQHGQPATEEKLLVLMNKGPLDEKEMLLRHTFGLGYPEPNVTFALCRGSRSSPALRVYTPDEVVNELERAKVEYLEASVGVTSKKKILVPKLLQWHMHDFADGMESLLEWIYSQLPHSGSLKRLMVECLNGGIKSSISKMVEIQPYESEFRYLLPS